VLLSVKYGGQRDPAGQWLGMDTSPNATKTALTHSLSRLGVDHIDIYRPSRLDTKVPIEDTIGAIAEMVKAGYVRHIGLSEVGPETIRRAAKVHPIVDLQIEYSLISRGPEAAIIPALAEVGAAMTAYSVLSRGLLTGSKPGKGDTRAHMPRWTGANAEKNQVLVDAFARLAAARGVKPAQLAIAYVRAKGTAQGVTIVPTLGARNRQQLADALSGLDVTLSAADVAEIESVVPASQVAGERYAPALMAHLDSERQGK
jgi:aryl-alcohol dehydrogenase-like predicted oxidoreductase